MSYWESAWNTLRRVVRRLYTRIMEHKKPRLRNTTQFWKNPKKKVYPFLISLETDNPETSRFFQLLETACANELIKVTSIIFIIIFTISAR